MDFILLAPVTKLMPMNMTEMNKYGVHRLACAILRQASALQNSLPTEVLFFQPAGAFISPW